MSEILTFQRLKWLSFTHSAIYLTLLVVWIVPGLHPLEFVFGMAQLMVRYPSPVQLPTGRYEIFVLTAHVRELSAIAASLSFT